MTRQLAEVDGEIRGEKYAVMANALVCSKCKHAGFEGTDVQEHMRKVADAYRRAHHLLASDDIRKARKALGMSQKTFAAYLQVGEASVKRWELGAIQDEAMDQYIRLKTDPVAASANASEVAQRVNLSRFDWSPIVSVIFEENVIKAQLDPKNDAGLANTWPGTAESGYSA
jgi:putative zinc finger/helix-turn-helix YgiT family protein